MRSKNILSAFMPALLLSSIFTATPVYATSEIFPCDFVFSQTNIKHSEITGFNDGDVFINPGEAVHINNAEITGSVKMTTSSGMETHVTVDNNSFISGDIKGSPANNSGDATICIRDEDGDDTSTVVKGAIQVENATGSSGIELRGDVEISGAVALDTSDNVLCGGDFRITGIKVMDDSDWCPILHADSSASGACWVNIEDAILFADFQADATRYDVLIMDVTGAGDTQVQDSIGDVYLLNIDSTSDVSVDGAFAIEWCNFDPINAVNCSVDLEEMGDCHFNVGNEGIGTGGDAGFSNMDSVIISGIKDVNGLLSVGPAEMITVTNNAIKGGIEVDVSKIITITDNEFSEGGLLVEGSRNEDIYLSETAVLERNEISGSLTVSQVQHVTVHDNTVDNGNLTILESETCSASGNLVKKGNFTAPGCGGIEAVLECTGTLENSNFPDGGELSNGAWYWCDEEKVYGLNGEVQLDGASDGGFDMIGATQAGQANLSGGKSYSIAQWNGNSWDNEQGLIATD